MKRALVACVLAVALVASGCGAGAQTGSGDAAKLAPAGTLAYASFELAPQGPEKQGFDAAFGKLLGPDPETAIAKALVDAVKEQGSKLDYQQDVKPWLGDTASVAVTGVGADHARPDFALLLASTNDDKARAAIDTDLAGKNAESRNYRGVDYRVMSDGTANGVVSGFLVAGTEPAFKAVVDTSKDGNSLADSQAWHDSVGSRGDGKIGLAYVDLKAVIQSVLARVGGAERVLAPLALGLVQLHPFVATLSAGADSFVLDVSSPGTPADKRGPGAASSPLIETLPGDSWFALALPKVGPLLEKLVGALKLNPLIAAQYTRLNGQLRQHSGLDLERDLLAGISDVGAFARGTSLRSLDAGVVVVARDRAALRRTVAGAQRLVRGGHLANQIHVQAGGPGAVAVYGSTRSALAPATRLGSSGLYRRAASELGARPTLFVSIAPLLQLAGTSPKHRHALTPEDRARLGHLDYLAVGAVRDGGLDVVRAVLGIH